MGRNATDAEIARGRNTGEPCSNYALDDEWLSRQGKTLGPSPAQIPCVWCGWTKYMHDLSYGVRIRRDTRGRCETADIQRGDLAAYKMAKSIGYAGPVPEGCYAETKRRPRR